jgi:hypothetical protein
MEPMPPTNPSRCERIALVAAGVLALAPLVLYAGRFSLMYWFGDEFDLIDQGDRMGLGAWIWTPFAENWVPLFKIIWRGMVSLTGGSYFGMVCWVYAVHGLNVALLGRVMRRCGLSWTATAVALVLFGLAPTHAETLTWTVQSSAVLSITFMLLAIDAAMASPFSRASYAWVTASAVSFSRGVLTGGLLFLSAFWPGAAGARPWTRRMGLAVLYLVPPGAVAYLIAHYAGGNEHAMAGHWGQAAAFGTWYYTLNPAHLMLAVESRGWHTVAVMGLAKFALVGWALARSRGSARLLFALLVVSDLCNAFLLGVGRYHTGLDAALSSRYQYASLIGIAPLFGFWIDALLERVPAPVSLRRGFAVVGVATVFAIFCIQWRFAIQLYSDWRGVTSRRILLEEPNPGKFAVPGIPFMETTRARELIKEHNLH